MKIWHTNKHSFQKEPMDLSLQTTRSEDVPLDMNNSGNDNDVCQKLEESEPAQNLLGDNNNITNGNSVPVVPQTQNTGTSEHDKYKKVLDALCKTWSEVKLLQMKSSVVEFYLNKNKNLKGDNTVPDPPSSLTRFSRFGRPIRKTISTSTTGVDVSDKDSDYESDFVKSPNRKCNHSKPHASGPSASRVAAQNKKSGIPVTVLPSTSNIYKQSDSPVYSEYQTDCDNASISSSGSSQTFNPDLSDGDSDVTFDGFDPSDIKPKPKKGKGSLNTVQYGLRWHKRIRTYKC